MILNYFRLTAPTHQVLQMCLAKANLPKFYVVTNNKLKQRHQLSTILTLDVLSSLENMVINLGF